MTFRESVEILKNAGVENPAYDARTLWLEFVGGSTYPTLNDETSCLDFVSAVARRAAREPLQYIIGRVGFYREEYLVTRECLIPRSDTELLVDIAVERLPRGAEFADLCTGSGCVAISTLCNTLDTSALAVDLSPSALGIARKNAEKNGVSDRIRFQECDLMSSDCRLGGGFYAVLSNPPYVTETAYRRLEKEIFHEPRLAFVGGEDGLDFYRRLIPLAKSMILHDGFIAFEIGFDQGYSLVSLAEEHGLECQIYRDLSGLDRVAVLTYGADG